MNKIQTILWSIFSGLICFIYRSDALTVSRTCPWTLKSAIKIQNHTDCNNIIFYTNHSSSTAILTQIQSFLSTFNNTHKTNISTSCIFLFDRDPTGSGTKYYKLSSGINSSCGHHLHILSTKGTVSTSGSTDTSTTCTKYEYYKCDPTDPSDSGCCAKCPTAIQGVSEADLFGQTDPINLRIHEPGVWGDILCSNTDIYGKKIAELGADEVMLQIYSHTHCTRPEQQDINSCIITVASSGDHEYTAGEHSDHTGIYEYTANDVCEYEKQN